MSTWIIQKDSISEFPEHGELIQTLIAQRKEFCFVSQNVQQCISTDILRGTVKFVSDHFGENYFDPFKFSNFAGPLYPFLLNQDFALEPFGVMKRCPRDVEKFIRPNDSDKKFDGGVYNIKEFITAHHQILRDEDLIIIAHRKEVRAEHRFVIINDQVVAGSSYGEDPKRWYGNFEPAQNIANEFKPHNKMKAYTMDLCIGDEGIWKLVELNSFESSGLYECNISRIVLEMR